MEAQIITQQEQGPVKSGKGKAVLITVGLLGLGTLGFFGWRKWKSDKEEAPTDIEDNNAAPSYTPPPKKTYSAPASNDGFPLKRGNKGEKVKAIQRFLVSKGLLDAKDVIGEFGPKTEAGLVKAGFPKVIDQAAFTTITSSETKTTAPVTTPETPIDPEKFAGDLFNAALTKNFNAAISTLRQMKSTADYVAVSDIFKTRFLNGVRKTLVNGMLDSFTNPAQKETIRTAFKSMGLKYDGDKFTLSGINHHGIVTSAPTSVVDANTGKVIKVSRSMILGIYAGMKGKYTQFKNNGRLFLVPTAKIKFI